MSAPDHSSSGQQKLDDALKASFPASDPPAATNPIASMPGDKQDEVQAAVTHVYRIVHRSQAETAFAREQNQSGGRWTSDGIPAVYASTSPAGAVLEFLAHMDGEKPIDLALVSARMPGRSITKGTSLPAHWRDTPYRDDVREYGNAWIKSRQSLALCLPSVLCERSKNLLINPEHDDIGQLMTDSVEVFTLDPRLIRREP